MERIPHRELRNNSAEILRRVTRGESFEITNHGEVVAILQPPGREALRIYPATRKGGWSELRPARGTGESTQMILDELREDRV